MPNPVSKHSRHRTGQRRAQSFRLKMGGRAGCSNCGTVNPPHTVCRECGFYGGKLVLAKKVKKAKKNPEGGSGDEKA